jgi:hypothetical protein
MGAIMSEYESRLEEIDVPGPEDDPRLEIHKITDLKQLSEIAYSNTTKIRKIQRLQIDLDGLNPLHTKINDILTRRQRISVRLIQQRDKIQKEQAAEKRKHLEESLRPVTGSLNNQKRQMQDIAIQIYEKIRVLRKEHNGSDLNQRRLAARLKQWDSAYLMIVTALEKLEYLPNEIE